jgi:hypothetical protein
MHGPRSKRKAKVLMMARFEQDREDLLREATALVQRVEVRIPNHTDSIVVGFRRNGSGSVFIGGDPVFQFNQQNEFRRGFWRGKLIKAEDCQLIELNRVRTSAEVQLRRRELDEEEAAAYLELFRDYARRILAAIEQDELTVVGQVPDDVNLVALVSRWLTSVSESVRVANEPNVS